MGGGLPLRKILLLLLTLPLLAGCSGYSFSRAVYDGVQTRDQLQSTPAERAGKPDVNYDQYNNERKR